MYKNLRGHIFRARSRERKVPPALYPMPDASTAPFAAPQVCRTVATVVGCDSGAYDELCTSWPGDFMVLCQAPLTATAAGGSLLAGLDAVTQALRRHPQAAFTVPAMVVRALMRLLHNLQIERVPT